MTKGASLAKWLNNKTQSLLDTKHNDPSNSQQRVYNKESGQGVLARYLPDGEANPNGQGGGAATFLHKDIITPNQIYTLDGISWYPKYNKSQLLAIAKSPEHLGPKFIEARTKANTNSKWGWGVFYPHDSNALDLRATPYWDKKKNMIDGKKPKGFKAPAAYFDNNQKGWFNDAINNDGSKQQGSGNDWLKIGNPYAHRAEKGRFGLGTGVHVEYHYNDLLNCDKTQEFSWPNQTGSDQTWLRQTQFTGHFGEVNYEELKTDDNWKGFTDVLTDAVTGNFGGRKIGDTFTNGKLFHQGYLDPAIPWVNNPKDLINLQNSLYLNRSQYMTKKDKLPQNYWGWNEIPSLNSYWNDKGNIRGSIVSLPLGFKAKELSDRSKWKKVRNDIQQRINEYANYEIDGVPFDMTHLIDNIPIASAQTLPRAYNDELYEMSYDHNTSTLKGKNFKINSNGILDIY